MAKGEKVTQLIGGGTVEDASYVVEAATFGADPAGITLTGEEILEALVRMSCLEDGSAPLPESGPGPDFPPAA